VNIIWVKLVFKEILELFCRVRCSSYAGALSIIAARLNFPTSWLHRSSGILNSQWRALDSAHPGGSVSPMTDEISRGP
jgi:hypothetical protein